jgi:hypothetical protein
MGYQFNPITGKLDLVGSGGGGGATLGANTFTAGQTITAAANTSALTASYSVTGTNTTPLLDLSGTWNTTGIARGILLNITDTASPSTSRLLDLQTAGTSRFSVTKNGQVSTFGGLYVGSQFVADGSQARVPSNGTIGFAPGTSAVSWADTTLARDAANTLAQRNGTNAQTFRLYNTFTDASNFERGFMRWNSNVLEIGTEAGGTGAARDLRLTSGGTSSLDCGGAGSTQIRYLGSTRISCGANISLSPAGANNAVIISVGNLRQSTSSTPASATATGTTGDIKWDADFIYVCTATNTWKRAALSTW